MRYLAVSRFRLLTIVRTATPIFVMAILPPLLAALAVSRSEPDLRAEADSWLQIHAVVAMMSWLLHAMILFLVCLMSGKVRSAHDFVISDAVPDLMDTAPITDGARFWGEALGTLGAAAVIHLCCLPLLTAVAALSPIPTAMFLWIEGLTMALLMLASTGAAWQRRMPRTKYSASRGPRNVAVLAMLLLVALFVTARPGVFHGALFDFVFLSASMQGWSEIAGAVENPFLLITLLSVIYAGTIAYYYVSATRKQVWEN